MRTFIALAVCAVVGLASSPIALAVPVGYVVVAGSSNPPPAHCLTWSLSGGALYGRNPNPQAIGPDGTSVGSAPIGSSVGSAPIGTSAGSAPVGLDPRICRGRLCQ